MLYKCSVYNGVMLGFCALRREITANRQFFLFFLCAKCNFFEIILKSGILYNVWPCSNFVLFNKCTFSFSSKHMIRNHTQPCVHDTKKKVGAIFSLIDKCIDHYLIWYCKCNIFCTSQLHFTADKGLFCFYYLRLSWKMDSQCTENNLSFLGQILI